MASDEIQEFAERLNQELDAQRIASRHGYLHPQALQESIRRAANPPGSPRAEFPRMLFLHGDPLEYKIVANEAEEVQATAQGYLRSANPPDPNYPQMLVEVDPSRGTDYRRVRIKNAQEEQNLQSSRRPDEMGS
jgi:hypothetical protein